MEAQRKNPEVCQKNASFKAEVAFELRLERLIQMYQEKSWGKVLEADGKACRKALILPSEMKIFGASTERVVVGAEPEA